MPSISASRFVSSLLPDGRCALSLRDDWYIAGGKRALDLILTAAGLVLFAIPLLAGALLIRVTSPGTVFYTQERVGRSGRVFRIWKLRTMRVDAESDGAARFACSGDRRITPVGGLLRLLRLDEVPQLWNILRGEMSIVGPRPERPCFVDFFQQQIPGYHLRHRLRPGLTGWAQIHLGYCSTLEQTRAKTALDLAYLDGLSFATDLRILARTPLALLGFCFHRKTEVFHFSQEILP